MTEQAIATTENPDDKRKLALLKAIGFDKLQPEQRELGMNIAKRYDLDLLLKHLVIIEGRVYITRDGLVHIAHRSKKLDGIETTEPAVKDGFWRVTCSVYRKDMSRPFTYFGRYPISGGNQKYAPEMAVKVSEVMALRRAFDVSVPTQEERWDGAEVESESAKAPTLAERTAAKAAEIAAKTPVAVMDETNKPTTTAMKLADENADDIYLAKLAGEDICGETSDPRLGPVDTCSLPANHPGIEHQSAEGAIWTSGKPRKAAE